MSEKRSAHPLAALRFLQIAKGGAEEDRIAPTKNGTVEQRMAVEQVAPGRPRHASRATSVLAGGMDAFLQAHAGIEHVPDGAQHVHLRGRAPRPPSLRHAVNSCERLDQRKLVERLGGPRRPGGIGKHEVAVKPGDLGAGRWERCQGKIEEALLLPHHIVAAEPDENVGIPGAEFEIRSIGELDGDQRNERCCRKRR